MTSDARDAFIDLLKRSLLGLTVGPETLYLPKQRGNGAVRTWLVRALKRRGGAVLAEPVKFDLDSNSNGSTLVFELPPWSKTMVGPVRLDNVEACIRNV